MKVFLSLLILMSSVASLAAPSTSIMSAEERKAMAQRWGGMLQTDYATSLYDQEDGSKSTAMDFKGEISYKLTRNYKVKFHLDATQDLQHQEDSDLGMASLGLSHSKIKVANQLFLLTPSTSIRLPISRADQRASFITAVSVELNTAINPSYLISKKLDLSISLGATRYVHTYSEAENGDINTQYKLSQAFNIGWNFTDWLGISAEVDHINAWDYNGIQKEFYAHAEEIDFTLNKNWALAVGHQYGLTSVWAANQQDYNFNLVDEQNSLVFGQVTYTF